MSSAHLDSVILEYRDVSVNYGAVNAVNGISFSLKKGQILTLIGANGAGKTTILRACSGLVKLRSGSILHKGDVISGLPAHKIVRRGLCQAPEGRGIFLNLTVEENLDLGAIGAPKGSDEKAMLEHVFELFPRLKERRTQNAGTLSGGEQQMLAIGRAMMGYPEVLLLDEPSLGLAPQIIQKIFEIIVMLNKQGKTILLVEQNARQALTVAHEGLVLETGKIVMRGDAKVLLHSDQVRQAYLGEH